jgi:hypothetical protein
MKLISAAVLALFATTPVFANDVITLDFEGAPGYANPIANYYNGGTDGQGRIGPNYGVAFSDAVVALSNDDAFTYFSHAPSPVTAMFAFDPTATMNVAAGFVDSLSFYYSSGQNVLDAVSIYSGLNGTGTLLATLSLFGNAQTGCDDTPYCRFDLTSVHFAGVAKSVNFGGNASDVVYDNVSFAAAVPEPSTYALMALGLVGLAAVKRRRAR